MPQPLMPKRQRSWSWMVLWRSTRASRINLKKKKKKDVLFIIWDWNAKVGRQEIPEVKGKSGLGVQNEAGQRLTEFWKKNTGHNNTRDDSTHGHHHMVKTKVRLTIFFADEDREILYSQQIQDWELTAAQIRNSLLQNSVLNWRK